MKKYTLTNSILTIIVFVAVVLFNLSCKNGVPVSPLAGLQLSLNSQTGGTSPDTGTPGDGDTPVNVPVLDSVEFARRLEAARSSSVTKSVSAAIMTGDGTIYTAVANQAGDPYAVTSDMHFSIASCTKMFIAACVFQLVEDNLLSLDDTLQTLIYDTRILDTAYMAKIDPHIRVRDLLNHTTGLDDYLGNGYYYDIILNVYATWFPKKTLSYVDDPVYPYNYVNPEDNPCNYSNTDYIILGIIIENLTGQSVSRVVRDYFLDPLGLVNTFMVGVLPYLGLTWAPGPNAIGFEPTTDTDSWEKAWIKSSTLIDIDAIALYSSTWTSGNMLSDASDMVRWARYFYRYQEDKGYLADEAFHEASVVSDFFTGRKFGYGIEYLKHVSGSELWGHTGTIMGFNSMVFYMPEKDVSIAILINDHYIWRWGILHVLVDYVNSASE